MVSDLFDDPKTTFGIDIGYDSLKVIQLQKSGHSFNIKSINSVPLPTGLVNKQGINDIEKVSAVLRQALNEAEPNRVSGHFVITSLPESQVFSKIITLPKLKLSDMEKSIQFEAAELFPIPPEELYLDWQILYEKKTDNLSENPTEETEKNEQSLLKPTPAATQINAPGTLVEILLVAAPKKIVESYQEVTNNTGLELAILETKSISSARAILEPNSKDCLVLVDIGAEKTSISIIDEGVLRFTGTASCGGNNANQSLTAKEKLPENNDDKKKILREIDKNIHINPEEKKALITKSILPIIEEINQSIRYYHNRIESETKISKILLTGGGSNLPYINEILETNTGYHTGIANPFINITQPKDQSYSSFCAYTAALGCALRPFMEQ